MKDFSAYKAAPSIVVQWAMPSRGWENSLNPLDHPWNFDSAAVAKSRLRAVIQADRRAIPVWRWVATSRYTAKPKPVKFIQGLVFCFNSPMPSGFKRHYRWERRS